MEIKPREMKPIKIPSVVSLPPPSGVGFDYRSVENDTGDKLRQDADEIRALQRTTALAVIDIGVRLLRIKEYLHHGQFVAWLGAEFGWSARTAQNYMRVAEVFRAESEIVAGLPLNFIYRLAARSTRDDIRDKVIHDLEVGREIDCKAITAQIERSRPRKLSFEKENRIAKAVQKAQSILDKLPADDADHLLQLLGTPRVIDRLKYERSRLRQRRSKTAV